MSPGLGYSAGYRATGNPGSGIVAVTHHFCPAGSREDPAPHLARYAEVIAKAGYATETGPRTIVVTAPEGHGNDTQAAITMTDG